jgi:hypothetical protein
MDLGTALLNTFVVLAVGTALGYLTNDRFKALRREMDAFRTGMGSGMADLHAEIVRVETRLETRIDSGLNSVRSDLTSVRSDLTSVRSDLTSVRSDLTLVALAVGAKRRTEPA